MIQIDPALLAAAQERFAALQAKRELMQSRREGGLSLGRLYAFAAGKSDEMVARLVGSDLVVRRVYRQLLQGMALVHIPQAQAASSEDYPERHADGCRVRLQASRAESQQLYLIVEMSDVRRDMPKAMELFGGDDSHARLDLPPARNGTIQTIIETTSSAARLLSDPKTEIILR